MKINIFGMGYVGCVSAACLANNGFDVTGIDVDQLKVEMINEGKSPIVELGLSDAVKKAVVTNKLKATKSNIAPADISIVCVGTPSNENGSLKLQYIIKVAEQLGDYLRKIDTYHVVIIRSTVLPGTTNEKIIPIIEKRSKKKAGLDFGICMNPEFMREGSSIYDYYNPPFTVIGELDSRSGDVVSKLYYDVNAPLLRTTIKTSEMIKYACNAFHALKVSFANEIGNICKKLNINSHDVMDIFCNDKKLNLSPYYLKPGFAFGGSCLPKDIKALLYKGKELDLETPVLSSILKSNHNQIEIAYRLIANTGKKKIGMLGLSFKPGTDDLRESPVVELTEKLIGKGYILSIYDKEVSLAKIFGSNKKYIEQVIPHISSLMKNSVQDVIESSQVVVVTKNNKEFVDIIAGINKNKTIIDLVKIVSKQKGDNGYYEGISW